MDAIAGLPDVAWEQGLFVVLFLIAIVLILRFNRDMAKEWQDFIKQQQDAFLDWMENHNKATGKRIDNLTDSLNGRVDNLTGRVDTLTTTVLESERRITASVNMAHRRGLQAATRRYPYGEAEEEEPAEAVASPK